MKIMKVFINLIVVLISVLMVVCAQASQPQKLQKLTVILDWLVNPDHAPLFVAQQQGFYRQQGLQVNFIAPADPSDPPKLVAAGKADIAVDYQPHLLLEIAQGLPLKEVGVLVDSPLDCLAVLKSSAIHNLRDLKGKRIAYSTGGIDNLMVQAMLANQGLKLNDVEMVSVGYNLNQALVAKNVDAATGLMRNIDLTELALAGHPARAFYPEDYGFPHYDELIFIANSNHVNDARIKLFLAAVKQGVEYLHQHPDTSWQKFAKQHAELNNQLNRTAWFNMIPYFANNPQAINRSQCQTLVNYLNEKMNVHIPIVAACD